VAKAACGASYTAYLAAVEGHHRSRLLLQLPALHPFLTMVSQEQPTSAQSCRSGHCQLCLLSLMGWRPRLPRDKVQANITCLGLGLEQATSPQQA
jgi:hypothetical protein